MADAALLLTIIVALFVISGLIRFVLRQRRAARSLMTTSSSPAGTIGEGDSTSRLDVHAEVAAETDAERRERLVEQAFLAGGVPAVWYRHAKAALAAEDAEAERTHG